MNFFRKSPESLDRDLMGAITQNDLAAVKKAVARGASVHGENYSSPLYMAVKMNRDKVVTFLLEQGANPNELLGTGSTMLLQGLEAWRGDVAVKMLDHGADPNLHAMSGLPPLFKAFEKSRTDAILKMIEKGVDVNTPYKGVTPLQAAVAMGYMSIITKMLDSHADVNVADANGKTPLHIAAANGRADIVILLMARGADETLANNDLKTPSALAEKDYPYLAAILRGERPGTPPDTRRAAGGWVLVADDEVARVTAKNAVGYRVTELFNFSARTYTQISRNLDTGAESSAIKAFSSVSEGGMVAAAQAALESLGGHVPSTVKKKLPGATTGMGA